MKKDKLKLYFLELILVFFLVLTLFASIIEIRWILAIFLSVYLFIIQKLLGKRGIKSIYEKQVTILMLIIGFLYLVAFYGIGLYSGFEKTKYIFSMRSVIRFIIPTIIIIYTSEKIRYILLSQNGDFKIKGHAVNPSVVLVFIGMVLVDYIIYANMYDLNHLDDFLTAIGFILFSSMSNNLLFNYASKRFGFKPIVVFRLITVLYIYLIPVQPDLYIYLRTFLRIVYPFIIYMVLERTYARNRKAISFKDKKKNVFGTSVMTAIIVAFIMLVSCQFKYGIIVIGTDSMDGTIDRGDAVIFERFDNNKLISEGQIIMFDLNGLKTIHRVVQIRNVNGITRYYTQGDANKDMDLGYRTINDIEGLVNIRIKYIGLPTLFVRSLFK